MIYWKSEHQNTNLTEGAMKDIQTVLESMSNLIPSLNITADGEVVVLEGYTKLGLEYTLYHNPKYWEVLIYDTSYIIAGRYMYYGNLNRWVAMDKDTYHGNESEVLQAIGKISGDALEQLAEFYNALDRPNIDSDRYELFAIGIDNGKMRIYIILEDDVNTYPYFIGAYEEFKDNHRLVDYYEYRIKI